MGPQEVIISDPERQVIVRAFDPIEAVRMAIRSLIGTVEPFDQLFVRTEFSGNGIIVRKADHLRDLELHPLAELNEELLGSQRVGTVAVSDKEKIIRQPVPEFPEGHAHCHDAGPDAAVV